MKINLTVALLSLGICGFACADCTESDKSDCPPSQELITVDASFVELPYGQTWRVTYAGADEVEMEIQSAMPRWGTIAGKVRLAPSDSEKLRKVVGEQKFFELSKNIAKGYPLHHPDLRLRITMGAQTHDVRLYSPRVAASHPETARFLAVWNEFFTLMPVQPSWQ